MAGLRQAGELVLGVVDRATSLEDLARDVLEARGSLRPEALGEPISRALLAGHLNGRLAVTLEAAAKH